MSLLTGFLIGLACWAVWLLLHPRCAMCGHRMSLWGVLGAAVLVGCVAGYLIAGGAQ